jgi:hypothetical protein
MLQSMIKSFAALLLLAAPAMADAPKAPALPPQDEPHVSRFGDTDKTCLEWTDSCQICIREKPDTATHCSTPGIACTPAKASCTRR